MQKPAVACIDVDVTGILHSKCALLQCRVLSEFGGHRATQMKISADLSKKRAEEKFCQHAAGGIFASSWQENM